MQPGAEPRRSVRRFPPVDQEGKDGFHLAGAGRQPPVEADAVGADPGHGPDRPRVVAGGPGRADLRLDVVRPKRPSGEAGLLQAVEAETPRRPWSRLGGVGSDDLEVGPASQTEQRVVGPPALVAPAGRGPDAEPGGEVVDARFEIGHRVDEVVDGDRPGSGGGQWPGVGLADGLGLGDGVGVGLGDGVGAGVGAGVGLGDGVTPPAGPRKVSV